MAGGLDRPARRCAVVVADSDGIGLALTRRLLAAGWTVTGLSRSGSDLVHERYAHAVIDVTAASYQAILAAHVDALGGIDLCVYTAGIGEFIDVTDLSSQTRTLQVNLPGAASTVEVVVPRMVAAGGRAYRRLVQPRRCGDLRSGTRVRRVEGRAVGLLSRACPGVAPARCGCYDGAVRVRRHQDGEIPVKAPDDLGREGR